MLEIRILGQFDVRLDGKPVEMRARPLRLLLAYLALKAGQSIPREKIAGVLWPDTPEGAARKNLQIVRDGAARGSADVSTQVRSTQFDFGHIQPTAVLWSVMNFKFFSKPTSLSRLKSFIQ